MQEAVNLSIYDPRVTRKQITLDLEKPENLNIGKSNSEGSWIFCNSIQECTINSDAILVLTEWDEFRDINWDDISKHMRKPSWVFDTRSISDLNMAKKCGLNTWRVGMDYN